MQRGEEDKEEARPVGTKGTKTYRSRSLGTKGRTSSTVSKCLEEDSKDCRPGKSAALGFEDGGVCGSKDGGLRVGGGEGTDEEIEEPRDSRERITGDALAGRGFLRTGDELAETIDRVGRSVSGMRGGGRPWR